MLDPLLRQQAERFSEYKLFDTLCRAPQTLGLPTPPLFASLSGKVVGGTGGTAAPALRLDPALRRLGFYANRLCAAPEDGCAYYLAAGGQLHRVEVTEKGGGVGAAPSGLPGWPAASGNLALLVAVRDSPDVEDPPCLLACDGLGQLWVCDDGGDPIGCAAIPLPLPAGCGKADGFAEWLLADARWSASETSTAGRVDCALLGYRGIDAAAADAGTTKAKQWCVLSVTIVLPSTTSPPSLHAAGLLTAEEPLALRCGAAGSIRCLLVIPPVWGTPGDTLAAEAADDAAADEEIEDIGEHPAPAAEDGREDEETALEELAIDSYSAVKLIAGAEMQLAVGVEQKLEGYRPLVSPSCLDLKAVSTHNLPFSLIPRDVS